MMLPPSSTGLYWSVRGQVACLEHVSKIHETQWIGDGWQPLPRLSQGHHGLRYQCQYCSPDHTAIVHPLHAS